jgi:hypothetical protein
VEREGVKDLWQVIEDQLQTPERITDDEEE